VSSHKHAEVITAWANGAEIQFRDICFSEDWKDTRQPQWDESLEYRVKPAEPERPRVGDARSPRRLADLYDQLWRKSGSGLAPAQFADDVLRHACDAGQIVTREEFDRAVGDRKARDMAVAEAVRDAANKWIADRWNKLESSFDLAAIIAEVKA